MVQVQLHIRWRHKESHKNWILLKESLQKFSSSTLVVWQRHVKSTLVNQHWDPLWKTSQLNWHFGGNKNSRKPRGKNLKLPSMSASIRLKKYDNYAGEIWSNKCLLRAKDRIKQVLTNRDSKPRLSDNVSLSIFIICKQ